MEDAEAAERERLARQWELDWKDTKDKIRGKIRGKLMSFEKKVISNTGLEKYLNPLLGGLRERLDGGDEEEIGAGFEERAKGELRRRGSTVSSPGDWLLDGNLGFLGLNEESDAELGELCPPRTVLGYVKVRVKSLVCEDVSKVYFEMSVERETIISPISFVKDGLAEWEMEGKFPITDLAGYVRIRLKSVSTMAARDKHIGSVLLPLRGLERATAVYAPYPLTKKRTGIPGNRRAEHTGLDRDRFDPSLALTVRHELVLLGPKRLRWPLYLQNRRFVLSPDDSTKEDKILAIDAPKELLESLNEVKRNASRIETALTEMLNSLPVLLLLHLRSWTRPLHSASACVAILAAAKWLTASVAPMAFFFCVAGMCVLSKKNRHENVNWVVWNDEIDLDSDSKYSTVQRLAMLVQKFDRGARVAGIVATLLEKGVNAWNFSDPEVTIIVLQLLFAACVGASVGVQVCEFIGISPLGPMFLLTIIPIRTGGALLVRAARLALCLVDKMPSHDDLGRAWMARRQTIKAESE